MSVKKKSFTNYKQYSLGSFRKDSTGLNLGSISLQKMGSFEPSKARVACQFTPLPKSEDMMGKPKPSIRSVCHWLKGWIGGFSSKTRKKSPDLTVPARAIFDFHIGLSIPLVPRFQSSRDIGVWVEHEMFIRFWQDQYGLDRDGRGVLRRWRRKGAHATASACVGELPKEDIDIVKLTVHQCWGKRLRIYFFEGDGFKKIASLWGSNP